MSNVKPDLSYLDQFFGPPIFSKEGIFYPKRSLIELEGIDIEDDAINKITRLSASALTAESIAAALGYAPAKPWQTVLDLDFSAQANATYASNATISIGGIAGIKRENAANDAAAMAIANGSGLRIQTTAGGGDYGPASRNNPLIWIPFASFMPADFSWTSGFVAMLDIVGDTALTNNGTVFAVEMEDQRFSYNLLRYNSGGNELCQTAILEDALRPVFQAPVIPSALGSGGLIAIMAAPFCAGAQNFQALYAGQGLLPTVGAYGALKPLSGVVANSSFQGPSGASPDLAPINSKFGILIGGQSGGGAGGPGDITIKRVRVDVRL